MAQETSLSSSLSAFKSEAAEIRRLFAFQAEAESLCVQVGGDFW